MSFRFPIFIPSSNDFLPISHWFPIDFPQISHGFSHLACWPLPCPTGHSGPRPKCQVPKETQRVGAWTYGDFVVDLTTKLLELSKTYTKKTRFMANININIYRYRYTCIHTYNIHIHLYTYIHTNVYIIYIYISWMAWRWSQHNRGTPERLVKTSRFDFHLGYWYLALLYDSSSNGIFIPDWWTEFLHDFHLGYSYLGYWDYYNVRDPPRIIPPMSVVLWICLGFKVRVTLMMFDEKLGLIMKTAKIWWLRLLTKQLCWLFLAGRLLQSWRSGNLSFMKWISPMISHHLVRKWIPSGKLT